MQVLVLRLLSFGLYCCGALLLIPIFAERQRSFAVSRSFGKWLSLAVILANQFHTTTLGNDSRSLLVSSIALYAALVFWRTTSNASLIVLVIAVVLAVMTKYTNLSPSAAQILTVLAVRRAKPSTG